ncbi:16S rRNA (guanine(527)-N(7))-methyltransferase RsmG [Celeribacter marinus]|uniref:16S rRNA (guanine(527)-N(7))-methyltransferase RsmG n=1 Tax=Celeribacter marinus TaxID=1397108 RepID=UPI003F6BB833
MNDFSLIDLVVSRETMERLEHYDALLKKWTPVINLVSKSTLDHSWSRHFLDSAQVYKSVDNLNGHWVDLGSGGGFPGVVCAIIAAELAPKIRFTLIEADQRKSTFLRTVLRDVDVNAQVLSERVENAGPQAANILTARALSSLKNLLEFSDRHLVAGGSAIFPKGANFRSELEEAKKSWAFSHVEYPSVTDENAVIIKVGDIVRG